MSKQLQLPTNRKFGLFLSFVFLAVGTYLLFAEYRALGYTALTTASMLLILASRYPSSLGRANDLWMKLGIAIGRVMTPILMGLIFFGLFTPIALVMKLLGRDELRLKKANQTSFWIEHEDLSTKAFEKQF